jgi:lysophospholipase L1-like esterase
MNLDKVEFYNLGACEAVPGIGEHGLMRVPAKVRNQLNERARFVGMDSVGIEIRFITDAPNVDLYLSMLKPEFDELSEIHIYKGDFLVKIIQIEPGVPFFYRLNPPPEFEVCATKILNDYTFSPNVWRIVCNKGVCVFHGIDVHGHTIRPPQPAELPKINWLAYGSSITHADLNGYSHFAATKLGYQIQNRGFSGACQIEKNLVDYLLDACQWDIITCELGVNMRASYTPQEFKLRAEYLIQRLAQIAKPAFIISIFPNSNSVDYTAEIDRITADETAYNKILKQLVEATGAANIHFINGYEILTEFKGLSADLIHPTIYGHSVMGYNLATKIENIMNG